MIIQLPDILNLDMVKAIPKRGIVKEDAFGGRGNMVGIVREGVYTVLENGVRIGLYITDPEALTVKELMKICDFYKKPYDKREVKGNLIKILNNEKV